MPTHIHVYMQRERYREIGIDTKMQGEGKGRRQKIQSLQYPPPKKTQKCPTE